MTDLNTLPPASVARSYLTVESPAALQSSQWVAAAQVPPSCAPHPQWQARQERPLRLGHRSRIHTADWWSSAQSRSQTGCWRATAWWTPPPALSTCSARESAETDAGPRTSPTPSGQKCPKHQRLTWQKLLGIQRSRPGGCEPPGGNMEQSSQRLGSWWPECRWHKASRRAATAPGMRRHDAAKTHVAVGSVDPSEGRRRRRIPFNHTFFFWIMDMFFHRQTLRVCFLTFSDALERGCVRMRAPHGTMLRLMPPRMRRAPRHVYFSTSSWNRGLKAKEESPILDSASPRARVRRRVKWAMTVATMGVKTSPQPRPRGGGGQVLLTGFNETGKWMWSALPERTPMVR